MAVAGVGFRVCTCDSRERPRTAPRTLQNAIAPCRRGTAYNRNHVPNASTVWKSLHQAARPLPSFVVFLAKPGMSQRSVGRGQATIEDNEGYSRELSYQRMAAAVAFPRASHP